MYSGLRGKTQKTAKYAEIRWKYVERYIFFTFRWNPARVGGSDKPSGDDGTSGLATTMHDDGDDDVATAIMMQKRHWQWRCLAIMAMVVWL